MTQKKVKYDSIFPDEYAKRVLEGTAVHQYNLLEEETLEESVNKWLKEYESCFRNGDILIREIDGIAEIIADSYMEPEDVLFCRDLKWVPKRLNEAYELGKSDAQETFVRSEDLVCKLRLNEARELGKREAGEEFRSSVAHTKALVCKLEDEIKYWKNLYEAMRR